MEPTEVLWLLLASLLSAALLLVLYVAVAYQSIQSTVQQRRQANPQQVVVAFFHPYCNAGGGGERVLWCAVRAVQQQYPHVTCVVYTGDKGVSGKDILSKAAKAFDVKCREVQFVFLNRRAWVEASRYPVLTLLGQSLGSMLLGWEALRLLPPDVYLDTMGYAFTLPIFRFLGGCRVGCYVHYPTISTDMLGRVMERRATYNNRGAISRSVVLSSAKLYYYRLFAWLYGHMGRCAESVMVNSTWTYNNIKTIWAIPDRTVIVYPPCDTEGFQKLPLTEKRQRNKIVSVAQFRPEKDHSMQLHALKDFFELCPDQRESSKLVLVGGCRDAGDEERVRALKKESHDLGISDHVEIKTNVTYAELTQHLESSVVGLHTMWNEHFGIGIVEYMAAGAIPLAHDSGGPRADIVVDDYNGQRTGYRATTAREYAERLKTILVDMTAAERLQMQKAARASVSQRFSGAAFDEGFLKAVGPLL
eukprot:comp16625_c0_seq1/m.14806 comp16625_c0_seq1/g.14806  ORF comp16625_c0_seq1/g.14806 comp16625_c0_seq1/m.14806 type:complete len:475 (-) comp16625_c0_seq1:38-1462(-)